MNSLPLKVCNQIISYLTCREKQKLSLVCRRWHRVIEDHSMLSGISVMGKKEFEAAALYFEQNDKKRRQVRILRLHDTEASALCIVTLPERLPSLQDFVWTNVAPELSYKPIHRLNVQQWKNITSYEETNCYSIFKALLKQDNFINLTKLILSFQGTNILIFVYH